MKLKFLYTFLLVGIGFSSCNELKPEEFIKQVNDEAGAFNSKHSFESKNLLLNTVFKPAEFNALMDLDGDTDYRNRFRQITEEQEASLRFDFRISCLDPSYDIIKDTLPPDLYIERIEYLTSAMKDDISLVMGTDTLMPNFFHFERTYNIMPYNNFLLGFDLPRDEVRDDIKILYDDKLFGVGRVEFEFDKNTINQKYPIDL